MSKRLPNGKTENYYCDGTLKTCVKDRDEVIVYVEPLSNLLT